MWWFSWSFYFFLNRFLGNILSKDHWSCDNFFPKFHNGIKFLAKKKAGAEPIRIIITVQSLQMKWPFMLWRFMTSVGRFLVKTVVEKCGVLWGSSPSTIFHSSIFQVISLEHGKITCNFTEVLGTFFVRQHQCSNECIRAILMILHLGFYVGEALSFMKLPSCKWLFHGFYMCMLVHSKFDAFEHCLVRFW
jgi:hypothetical protein